MRPWWICKYTGKPKIPAGNDRPFHSLKAFLSYIDCLDCDAPLYAIDQEDFSRGLDLHLEEEGHKKNVERRLANDYPEAQRKRDRW